MTGEWEVFNGRGLQQKIRKQRDKHLQKKASISSGSVAAQSEGR